MLDDERGTVSPPRFYLVNWGKQAILLNLFSMKEEKQHLSICRITGFGFMNYFSFEGSFRRTSGAIHWGCTEKNGGVQHLQTNASELTTLRTIILEQIADKKMSFKKEKKKMQTGTISWTWVNLPNLQTVKS